MTVTLHPLTTPQNEDFISSYHAAQSIIRQFFKHFFDLTHDNSSVIYLGVSLLPIKSIFTSCRAIFLYIAPVWCYLSCMTELGGEIRDKITFLQTVLVNVRCEWPLWHRNSPVFLWNILCASSSWNTVRLALHLSFFQAKRKQENKFQEPEGSFFCMQERASLPLSCFWLLTVLHHRKFWAQLNVHLSPVIFSVLKSPLLC